MTPESIVSIIAVLGALVLAVRGLRAEPVAPGRRVTMAVVWLVIIVSVVFLITTFGLEVAP